MKIKLNIDTKGKAIEIPINKCYELTVSCLHNILGNNNEYHDKFSNYSLSPVRGGKLDIDRQMLCFNEGSPYFYLSSPDDNFIHNVWSKVHFNNGNFEIMGFPVVCEGLMAFQDFRCHHQYDKIKTESPILLKVNGNLITVKDEGFMDALENNCKQKLLHQGINDPSFKIELISPELSKQKLVTYKEKKIATSQIRLKVWGKKKTRKELFELGLGKSTGCGFGCVSIYE